MKLSPIIFLATLSLSLCCCVHAPAQIQTGDEAGSNAAVSHSTPRFPQTPVLTEGEVRADFAQWLDEMRSLHPAFSLRTDEARFERMVKRIDADISGTMTQLEAWRLFSRLNPVLNDGHNVVLIPDHFAWAQRYLKRDGTVFPLHVHIDDKARLFSVVEASGGIDRGDEIMAINGLPASQIVADMLARAHGDTLRLRRALVAQRFPILFLQLFGDTVDYAVDLRRQDGTAIAVSIPGAKALPPWIQPDAPASELFQFRILEGEVGYLKAGTFDGRRTEAFLQFTDDAFAAFHEAEIKSLIIDIRGNGGGDDPLWQRGLMENITTIPYRHVSRFRARITEDNADPGDVIGEIVSQEYSRFFTPAEDNPIRFGGPTFILIGPATYSAAIQFAVAAQDHGIAQLAGEETGGFSCQTGRIKAIRLNNTKLLAFTPIFAFTRPSGQGCERGVAPDIPLSINPFEADAVIEALRAHAIESIQ